MGGHRTPWLYSQLVRSIGIGTGRPEARIVYGTKPWTCGHLLTTMSELNGTELFQVLVPSPFYLFTVLGKKKIGEKDCYPPSRWSAKCRLSAFDYGEKHLNSWGNSAGISCFTCTPYIHGLALKPKLQSFKVMQYHPPWWPGGAATFREHQLWWFNVYGALMLLHRALALGTLTGHFFNPCL